MTQKTLYMQCFFIVGRQASRPRQHGRRPTGAHGKHAQGASGPVGGDADEIGRFGLLVSCYGEGVPTGKACPPGGRAHREGVPTGRACPPGGRVWQRSRASQPSGSSNRSDGTSPPSRPHTVHPDWHVARLDMKLVSYSPIHHPTKCVHVDFYEQPHLRSVFG